MAAPGWTSSRRLRRSPPDAALAFVVAVATAAWIARGAGWPPFLSPLEFGERWISSFA